MELDRVDLVRDQLRGERGTRAVEALVRLAGLFVMLMDDGCGARPSRSGPRLAETGAVEAWRVGGLAECQLACASA